MMNLLERINQTIRGIAPRRAIASLLVAAECFSAASVGVPTAYAETYEGIELVDQIQDLNAEEQWVTEELEDTAVMEAAAPDEAGQLSPAEAAELGAQAAEQAEYDAELAAYDAETAAYEAETAQDHETAAAAALRAEEAANRAIDAANRAAEEAAWAHEAYNLADQEERSAADEAAFAADEAANAAALAEELENAAEKPDGQSTVLKPDGKAESAAAPGRSLATATPKPEKTPAKAEESAKPADALSDTEKKTESDKPDKNAELESAREEAQRLAAVAEEKAALSAEASAQAESAWAAANRAAVASANADAAANRAIEAANRARTAAESMTPTDPESEAAYTGTDESGENGQNGAHENTDMAGLTTLRYSDTAVTVTGEVPEGVTVKTSDVSEAFRNFDPESADAIVLSDLDVFAAADETAVTKEEARAILLAAYDISLALNGAEYQPESGRPLEVSITVPEIPEGMELMLWHIRDDETAERIEHFTRTGSTVTFTAESFSVYALYGYTVDFHWGDYIYNMGGEGEITLSSLLEKLGVTEITAADVANVTFSNPEYIAIEQLDSDWLLRSLAPFDTEEVLTLALKNGQSVEIKVTDEQQEEPAPTPVANLVYNGQPRALVTNVEGVTFSYALGENGDTAPVDTAAWSKDVPTATDAGTYYVWYKADGSDAEAQCVTAAITRMPLTITADSAEKAYDGSPLTKDTYTYTKPAEGDTMQSVIISGSQEHMGSSDNVPSAAVINNTSNEDVTSNYDITYVNGTLTVTWPENMVTKKLTAFNGNLATYEITVNPESYVLTADGQSYIVKDTFSENQSINYGSVNVSNDTVTYDFSGQTGTYIIPDGTKVAITYTTRVAGQVGTGVDFSNTAVVGSMDGTEFKAGPSITVQKTQTISPTGTDISGTGGVYTIDLFAYADGHMERGLGGAEFRLLDSNMRPMHYLAGENAGREITFTTGENGTVTIRLNHESDGLAIQKNTVYFLEMTAAPYEVLDGEYVYYQKDDTFYSFLITDEPSYKYGGIYTYFNGDVLKVRCYPEAEGINVTKRFSGNYTLTDAQKNAITFTLQKEAQYTAGGWVDVETHTYADFSYGSINFNTGRKGGTELEDFATYRIVEENALPDELKSIIEENVSVNVSYQQGGKRVTENSNEFVVDPDEKFAFSYDFAFTNEYVDHKLTIIKIDEDSGKTLPGTEFEVYAADNTETPVATCTTGEDGSITIRRSDEGVGYAPDTLYYVVESAAPEGYVLPADPEKVYFYFSENSSEVPSGLPSGKTATDLTTSYNTVTLPNSSAKVSIPVTVVWGINSNEAWPDKVRRVVVGLYKSVGGAAAEKVLDNNSEALTLELTKEKYYDTTTFINLPAQEDGKNIVYSVEEEGIYAPDGTNITNQFADSVSVSGTDWYVVKNEPAISVVVQKQWFEQDGTTPASDTSGRAAVTFDLYRTTTQTENTSFNRTELAAFLVDAEKVRAGLTLSKDSWSTTIDSLQSTDREGRPYYYYALENPIPDNQEDSYLVAPATASAPRTLTIKNEQTPFTVTIAVDDLEKVYGEETSGYKFTPDVKEDGAKVDVSGPDVSGKYTATVTDPQNEAKTINFTVSREEGENVGTYTITPSGEASQEGYRVLFETGKLTISPAEVTITAGASKVYGEDDPALVTVTGLKNNDTAGSGDSDTVKYTVSREEGEDVGDYPITLTGESDQGNYRVTYDRSNPVFTIARALATVTANPAAKQYGEDDPELTATVTGLQRGDEASVLNYDLTRGEGEDVGDYAITPAGEAEQGNYSVSYERAVFSITAANLTIKAVDAEKSYGDADPEWEVEIGGLYRDEEGGTLASVLDEATGIRTYTYTLGEGDEAVDLLTFTVTREPGEGVGSYTVTPAGAETQGNYTVKFEPGTLSIERAELFVTADHVVKAVGVETDPLLTATVTGWKNGDNPLEDTTLVSTETGEDGAVIRTYVRGTGAAEETFRVISSVGADRAVTWTYRRGEETLLTFTLQRDPGEEEGEYPIAASGDAEQSGYSVEYEQGSFGILSILDVDVKQPVIDYADTDAAPSYTYTAKLDLTGTGLVEYEKNGFTPVDGVPTCTFTLPDANKADTMTLKVPGGAKLTVEQTSTNDDYNTALSLDGSPYTNPNNAALCILEHVDTYHEMAFTHSRISYPVEARVSESQSEEGATKLEGRKGAMGIPTGEDLTRAIDADFADEMNSKIGYVLPTDKYYMYDHASLYITAGAAVEGASNVSAIKYDRENGKWQYKAGEGGFVDAPENTQLVLFYLPRFVCKVGTEKFYSLKAAVEYAEASSKTATIEMLIGEYSIRSSNEAVIIPEDCNITITTATTEYEGSGTAVISRSASYTAGHLFYNDGTLTFDNIILDGKNVQATDALVLNRDNEPRLNINSGATLRNASGNNGGAIYVKAGTVNVNGTLSGNTATYGGAVYVNAGTVTLDGGLTGNSATSGGAVYVNSGEVKITGTVSGNTATSGGAVYISQANNTKTTVTVSGLLKENGAVNGGAVYQASGTLTVSGSMSGNTASSNGGAVYQNGGTITVEATGSLSGNSATENGGAIYLAGGTLTNEGTIGGTEDGAGNRAANGGGIYRVGGSITVGGTVSGNTATNGGAIHSTGDTLNVDAAITGNSAANGGAIYVSNATLNLKGGSLSKNAATDGNGGAVYALNTTTVIGGTWSNNKAIDGSAVSFNGNTSTGNGGAVYMEGGILYVVAESELTENKATEGGAVYATSGAIHITNGSLTKNEAEASGGAICTVGASVEVKAGSLTDNTALAGNGGAIRTETGAVTVSGGTLSGNSAVRGEGDEADETIGFGGAIYTVSGVVTHSGGTITGNSAVNGAAIYVGSGIANISTSITGNTATEGGAIGVGSASARLRFNGDANVYDNKMGEEQRNVYLDVDSELVITAQTMNAGKNIGVYVPGEVDSDQVVDHGDVTGYFGHYDSTNNLEATFKNDRFGDLEVGYEYNRLYWKKPIVYDMAYMKAFDGNPGGKSYSATSGSANFLKVVTNKSYPLRTRSININDMIADMKLNSNHAGDLKSRAGSDAAAAAAVHAFTFANVVNSGTTFDAGLTYDNRVSRVEWFRNEDGSNGHWRYVKQDGTYVDVVDHAIIVFSAPAYLTIVNNNDSGLTLNISELNVLGYNVAGGAYGFVTARNGATAETLDHMTLDDVSLESGQSLKLVFPGAQGQNFTLKGTFDGATGSTIGYTIDNVTQASITDGNVDIAKKLNSNDTAMEIVFGEVLPICKIGNVPFTSLNDAIAYAQDHKDDEDIQRDEDGLPMFTIEMLVDYLVKKDDVLDIPVGFNITFTTASRYDETLPFTGQGDRAILSRDTGNTGASVTTSVKGINDVNERTLTVKNLIFDGRALTAGGVGGAILTYNTNLVIDNCDFSGYRSGIGGAAVGVRGTMTVLNSNFTDCQATDKTDKAGGGGIWSTAKTLTVKNCNFWECIIDGVSSSGALFHCIVGGSDGDKELKFVSDTYAKEYSKGTVTLVEGCAFYNCYSTAGSGGTMESDAETVTVKDCYFEGSYANKASANGGALNIYAHDAASTTWDCSVNLIGCTFKDCRSDNNGNGGAMRITSLNLKLENCLFINNRAKQGGAVNMTNGNQKKLEVSGCTFIDCYANNGNGGAISAANPNITVGTTTGGNYPAGLDENGNMTYYGDDIEGEGFGYDGNNHFVRCTANTGGGIYNAKDNASVTMENVHFTDCVARTGSGGALYTQAKTLSITGDSNTFDGCTGYGSGGAVFHNRDVNGCMVELENCVFTNCEAFNGGNGGGMYTNKPRTLTISGNKNGFINCTAASNGGGLYQEYAGTVTIENCGFDHCTALAGVGGGMRTSALALTITGEESVFKDCTAQTDGGGLYNATNLNGSSFTFRDGKFENCTAVGNNGGAIYNRAKTVTLADCSITGSTSKANGGGIYIEPSTAATLENCIITGNSVTNSDSKGGSVYESGGTITVKDSTVEGTAAGNGGGWYQNNGTLYILGGSISGSAVNGGGLYMNDSNAKVYQYGGAVSGTATANGGGVYKNNGTYTLGNGTYNAVEYTDGASVGAVAADENGNPVYSATAVNGGGIYQNSGRINVYAGGSITGQATTDGGGIYVGGGPVYIYGGVITNCQASGNGGGIYHTSTGNNNDLYFYGADSTAKIQNCVATNGGGVYVNSNTFHMGENAKTSLGTIENCHATANGGGVYQEGGTFNLRNTSAIIGCTADADGGGVYQAGGTFNQYDTSSIAGCSASNNGGGVYHAGGTFTFSGGSIIQNGATVNGGGVYHAGGAFSMTNAGAVIGGSEENANTANVGAGVFVADGQAATFNGSTVTYNHALTAGGGIAVGGPDAALTFQNAATVRNNTMGSQNTECNVYLDQDRNTIIKNNALNANAYIGVYASDDQDAGHGVQGMPFATWNTGNNNDKNLNVYHNDRRPYLYGMKGSTNNEVIWPEFVCKITDADGKLLYKDDQGTPAVYDKLENTGATGAFSALNTADTPNLYRLNEDGTYSKYTDDAGDGYQVQMLVEEYELASGRQIKLDKAVERKITLTTASTTEDECGFYYTGDARFNATIKRTAVTNTMVFVGGNNKWELTLRNITLDGGNYTAQEAGGILRMQNNGTAILDEGAVLQNAKTNNSTGAGVFLGAGGNALTMNAGSRIVNCSAGTGNGGGVGVDNGTFTMNGGSITGCSAANGGGVWMNNASKFYMNGGTITGNSATSTGGGISLNNGNSRITFSGHCTVTDNTLNGTTRCNVQLTQDSNAIINAKGLDARSEIGVYTASGNIRNNHGEASKPFGTRKMDDDKLFCFVNDVYTNLRGYQSADISKKEIYWEYHPLLTVVKTVSSDLSADQNKEFTFTVALKNSDGSQRSLTQTERGLITGMSFGSNGIATVTQKVGESATATFPDSFDRLNYEVTEVLSGDAAVDYTATAEKNGTAYPFTVEKPLTVSGQLGEFVGTENSTSLSEIVFTNTRATGNLTVSKQVVSDVESDKAQSFDFKVTLNDEGIRKIFETTKRDADNNEIAGTLSFTEGVSESFTLKHGESLTIKGLPTDLKYTVEEILTVAQKANIRTQVSKNGSEPVYAVEQDGTIGEKSTIETVNGAQKTVYASKVAFTNNFLEIVCKITNRSRALLYYRDAAGNLQPAIFAHLEDAFDQINSGNLRTSGNGTVSGQLRVEMVVPQYTMERTATLNSGKTVLLSTALTSDDDYPYNKGVIDGGDNVATVYRGFEEGGMIEDSGALTIDKIVLDGGSTLSEPAATAADGGIVRVAGRVRLTVNSAAKLQNSVTTGQGGAIWLGSGASLTMNGTISNCSAASGGGIYANTGFTTITSTGTITGCEATSGNGGAIYASTGTSVNLNAGTTLTGNAATENGGAVYTEANLILRGSVGGTGASEGNTADGNGGGIYMGEGTTFTMYADSSISGNQANNGGGLATRSTARIAGGTLQSNSATQSGGAIYAAERATVTISGVPVITGNEAAQGGAVYNGGTVTMTGGAMTGNTATEKGGAVYVAEAKTFTMSGGSIKDGNKSPEGAVSTDANATLAFSGNAVVSGNTDTDGTTVKNVYLGYDSNAIITSSGLGSSANIGVYVADGNPEPAGTPDRVDNPIYADHGVSGRDFGTYTGSNLSGARLNKFVNDRDTSLTGMSGTLSGGTQHIAWIGKGLELKVTQYLIQTDDDGNPVLDDDGNPVLSEEQVPVQNASFTFTRVTEGADDVQVWSGKSGTDGIVTIPWGGNETAGGNVASFVPGSVYRLDQTAAAGETVLPAGHWKVTIGRDNSVTWKVEQGVGNVDRTLNIALPEKAFLGETFGLKNDVKPTLTYNATGGKLSDNKPERQDTIAFTTKETSHAYTIKEVNPTWDSHVFKAWATMKEKPEVESTEQLTDEQLQQKLIEQGYFEYSREDRITFYRGTDSADPAEKYTQTTSKGDMTLYALWDEVVCKITDRNGTLLYIDGSPAVYGTLEDGFKAYNAAGTYDFTYRSGGRATARRIEMLVGEYELGAGVALNRGKTVMLTTAPRTDTDGYAYTGEENTVCVITRGEGCTGSMITNNSNLTLMNVTLDGDGHRNDRDEDRVIVCDGGIVNNAQASAVLTIAEGATLRNSFVEGNGGAVNAIAGTTVYLTGGTISGNSSGGTDGTENGNGAGIYLAKGSRLYLSGNPSFSNNVSDATLPDDAKNGAENYTQARQDIYLAGAAEEGEALTSITLTGNLPDNYPAGSIWVWAEGDNNTELNHYYMLKQFAVVSFTGTISEATCKAFRNARADVDTDCGGDYLTGQTGDNIGANRCLYWTGGFDFVFRKIDSFGNPLDGASFTLYRADAAGNAIATDNSGQRIAYQVSGPGGKTDAKAASAIISAPNAVTVKYTADNGTTIFDRAVYGDGLVRFEKIPPGTYFLVETTKPNADPSDSSAAAPRYRTVEEMYRVVLDGKGWYTISVADKNSTWAEAPKTPFANDGSGKYTVSATQGTAGGMDVYNILNVSPYERKVILRKVKDGSYQALQDAQFTLYHIDMQTVVSVRHSGADGTEHVETLENLTAQSSGVFWIGQLPYGVYYLKETRNAEGENTQLWFVLTVNENGVGYRETDGTLSNKLEQP